MCCYAVKKLNHSLTLTIIHFLFKNPRETSKVTQSKTMHGITKHSALSCLANVCLFTLKYMQENG